MLFPRNNVHASAGKQESYTSILLLGLVRVGGFVFIANRFNPSVEAAHSPVEPASIPLLKRF